MIGNDVVDIDASRIESNWKRKGFLEKIFTPQEQSLIKFSSNPELYVWVLWSMKEAAYKVYNRETGIRGFIPHELSCVLDVVSAQEYEGTVKCRGSIYFTTTTIANGIIHTIAVYPFLKEKKVVEVSGNILKDANGMPYIIDKSGLKIPVSKSGHGRCTKVVAISEYPIQELLPSR
jgi:phosphopantetheine--protein transferase-like protein